jgi:hypothetical protein
MAAPRPPNNAAQQSAASSGPRPRILRIGILLGGKIVEERLIRERATVSIGQSMKNTFSIPLEGLPLELPLFTLDHDKYYLRFLGNMDGRLSDGGNVNTLDALKGRGAQNHGDYWQVPLSDTSRGKLSLGDLTILFQFVTEPPRQPRPMLPASVRGTFADRFDPRLSVIMGASILIHFAIMIIAWQYDVESAGGIADRAYNVVFKQDTYQVDLSQPKIDTATQTGSAAETKAKEPDKQATKPTKPKSGGETSGRDPKNDVTLQEDQAKAMADLLTGEGDKGTSEGDMSKRRPGADLGQQIQNVQEGGKQVAVGGGAGHGSRDGDPRPGTSKGPHIDGPGGPESAGGGKVERAPNPRIAVSDKQSFDESSLSPDIVLAKIQAAYMAGLKRCYKEYLKKDATARGKVTLNLSINETGRTVKGNAKGFAGEVDECITAQMSSWRFPPPKDKDGEATDASFAITLQLVPD